MTVVDPRVLDKHIAKHKFNK